MSQPTLTLELALSTRPTEAPTWVDVTRFLRGPISLRRGGSRELSRFEAGRLDLLLDNADRRFDPSYAGALANTIPNPSFEGGDTDSDGVGNGWIVDASSAEMAGQYTCSIVTPGLGGSYAQRIVVSPLAGLTADRYLRLRTPSDTVVVDDTQDWVIRGRVLLSGLTGSVGVRLWVYWYDAAHGYLGSNTGTEVTTAGLHQLEETWTPPAGSAYVEYMVQIRSLSNGDAVTVTVDQCQVAPASIDAYVDGDSAPWVVNLCTNPSVETGLTGWVNNAACTVTRNAEAALYGAYGAKVVSTGNSAYVQYNQGGGSGKITVSPSTQYTHSLWVYSDADGVPVSFVIYEYAGAGYLGGQYHNATLAQGWQRLTQIATTAATCDGVQLAISGLDAGHTYYLDGWQLEQSATPTAYCDGDQPMCGWLGTEHASISQRYAYDDNCRWAGTAHASTSYLGGPYYGTLLPMRRARLSATWGGGLYAQKTGYIEGWPSQWDIGNYRVPISAQDGFKVISMKTLNGTYPEELSGERFNRVLDAVGWTTGASWILDSGSNSQLDTTTVLSPTEGDRAVMTGQTTVQGETLEAVNALDHLHNVNLAENGLWFISKGGAATFHDRHYRLKPVNQTSKATFGDDYPAGELPFVSFVPVYDDSELYNEVICTRKGGTAQSAEDATSQLEYFERTLEETGLLATTDAEMLDRANWTLSRRKDPRWRLESLTLDPEGDDALWPIVLGLELGDRITVNHRPGEGALIGGDYWIRHIDIRISEDFRWQVTYGLAPAETTLYWHISDGTDENAPFAILDDTTVLAY